jgi:hypothetical protein
MSRAQTIRLAFQLGGLAFGAILFLLLPFRGAIDFLLGVTAWLILGGIGERYFRKHATQEEIRADLEDRKNSPG